MDVRGNIVKLSDGTQISYDKCLIATGMLLIFFSLFFVLCQAFYFSGIYLIKFLQYVSNTWQSSHMKDSHTDNHAIGFFHLRRVSQLLWDVQGFALWKSAGKEEKVTALAAQ